MSVPAEQRKLTAIMLQRTGEVLAPPCHIGVSKDAADLLRARHTSVCWPARRTSTDRQRSRRISLSWVPVNSSAPCPKQRGSARHSAPPGAGGRLLSLTTSDDHADQCRHWNAAFPIRRAAAIPIVSMPSARWRDGTSLKPSGLLGRLDVVTPERAVIADVEVTVGDDGIRPRFFSGVDALGRIGRRETALRTIRLRHRLH